MYVIFLLYILFIKSVLKWSLFNLFPFSITFSLYETKIKLSTQYIKPIAARLNRTIFWKCNCHRFFFNLVKSNRMELNVVSVVWKWKVWKNLVKQFLQIFIYYPNISLNILFPLLIVITYKNVFNVNIYPDTYHYILSKHNTTFSEKYFARISSKNLPKFTINIISLWQSFI